MKPFLDTLVVRDIDNTIKLDWQRKQTLSCGYVYYKSNHSLTIKINIKQLSRRIRKIYGFVNKNLKILENVLLDKGCPKGLIRKIIYNTNEVLKQKVQPNLHTSDIKTEVLPHYDP